MQTDSVRFSTALWWCGICVWAGVSVTSILRAQSWERLFVWSIASTVFLVSFGIAQRLSRQSRILVAVQGMSVIAMVAVLCNGYEGLLLVLIAAQLGQHSRRAALTTIVAQTTALGFAIAYEWTFRSALLLVPPYLGFQFLMYELARMLMEERATRLQLEGYNRDLIELQQQLATKSRLDERLRMTQELHDVFGHRLTALSLNLEAMAHETSGETRDNVRSAQSLTRLLLDDVKTLVLSFKEELPVDLIRELRELARDLPMPHIHLDCPPELLLPDSRTARALLRCAQEIVTNSIRHGIARNVWLHIATHGDRVRLLGYDDGAGASDIREGFGLSGMRRRVAELGGALTINELPAGRFEISADLPISSERA
jgi:signal transduction histidine kinase